MPCVLPVKVDRNWRNLQNIGCENEVSVTSPSPCNVSVNKQLHVDENKTVYALSDNSLLKATDLYNMPKLLQTLE